MNDDEIIDWWIDAYNKHAPFCGYNDGDHCDECENIIQEVINKARADERAKLLKQMETIPDEFDCCNRLTELANKLKNIKKQSMWENER